ncbi:hypothetical protein DAPPUDRAFT_123940, partial [Daphnia pulex]
LSGSAAAAAGAAGAAAAAAALLLLPAAASKLGAFACSSLSCCMAAAVAGCCWPAGASAAGAGAAVGVHCDDALLAGPTAASAHLTRSRCLTFNISTSTCASGDTASDLVLFLGAFSVSLVNAARCSSATPAATASVAPQQQQEHKLQCSGLQLSGVHYAIGRSCSNVLLPVGRYNSSSSMLAFTPAAAAAAAPQARSRRPRCCKQSSRGSWCGPYALRHSPVQCAQVVGQQVSTFVRLSLAAAAAAAAAAAVCCRSGEARCLLQTICRWGAAGSCTSRSGFSSEAVLPHVQLALQPSVLRMAHPAA